jgi:signal transduction histidine kinase
MTATLARHGLRFGSSPAWLYLAAGVNYPLWAFVAPGPVDPFGIWLGISAVFLAMAAIAATRNFTRTTLDLTTVGLSCAVTVHFFLLADWNDMTPFYSVGSSMAVVVALLCTRQPGAMIAYTALVLVLGGILYLSDPDVRKLAYWAGPTPLFLFTYQRLKAQLALERYLEAEVAERTRQLSEANQRLREEIATRTRLEEALRVQHKVEVVARMAGGIAHDFNNMLTTIGVYAELLAEELPEASSMRVEVGHIQEAQREAAALTQQLLTLGRRSHLRLQVLDLDEVICDMSSLLQRVLDGHEFVFARGVGRHPIHGNVEQLRQLVLNLALNARDAMTEAGSLTIETVRCTRSNLERKLGVALDHETYVLLAVTDTGSGMTEETRCRAFDPFFSTKGPERGSGLGLSTVHAVVSQADGYVRLVSELGKGARFELYWPFARKTFESEPVTALPAVEVMGCASILLVEDEGPIRTALSRALVKAGHLVAEAADAKQALAILERSDTRFDLVITDVVMPQTSGFDLAEHVAQTRPDIKVLLISGYLDDRSLSDTDGRFAFLAKPFTPKALAAKVRELLAYSPTGERGAARSEDPRSG